MAPSVSITLVGRSYFLCGGGHNLAYDGTSDQSFRNALRHGSGVHNMYVVVVPDGSYYIHYHDQRGRCFDATRLGRSYSGLDNYLEEEEVNCTNSVSLSPEGYYFFRSEGRRAWCLPEVLDTMVDKALDKGNGNPLKSVWFGIGETYVAQTNDGNLSWSLQGHYGSLAQTLKYATKSIKSLGLNLTDGCSYILLWMDGSYQFNRGGCALREDDFTEWVYSLA